MLWDRLSTLEIEMILAIYKGDVACKAQTMKRPSVANENGRQPAS